ncbi:hypothetical protein ABT297_05870 [Dactylosporangium sp. NPDC000555]|uniref:hypothetical protein n=1 Tax=Dactylosporangium sp. NPDC000555 TaxID=3154260 RepID=UPI003320FC8C
MSSYGAGPAQESSRTFTVVLLSLLILTVLGALFGYVLGLRDIDENKSASRDPVLVPPAGVNSAASSRRPPTTAPTQCPAFIGQAAKAQDPKAATPLMLVQYIRTAKNQEVWICEEADGSGLWYQGHDMKQAFFDGGEIPKEGVNGLLRPGVVAKGYRTWSVTNDGTTYTVTPAGLKVAGKQAYESPAIQANPQAE